MKNTLKNIAMIGASALVLAFLQGCGCWDCWDPCMKKCEPCEKPCKPCYKPCKPCHTPCKTSCNPCDSEVK